MSLQNGAVPHTLRLDKVLMEVNSDRAQLGGDQPGTVGRRLAYGVHKRRRSEHRPDRVPAVFRKKTPGRPIETRRKMPLLVSEISANSAAVNPITSRQAS